MSVFFSFETPIQSKQLKNGWRKNITKRTKWLHRFLFLFRRHRWCANETECAQYTHIVCVVCHHFNSLIWLFQKMNHHPNMETWRYAWAVFKLLTDIGPLLSYTWTKTDVVVAVAAAITAAVVVHLVNGCFSSLLNRILITDICRMSTTMTTTVLFLFVCAYALDSKTEQNVLHNKSICLCCYFFLAFLLT